LKIWAQFLKKHESILNLILSSHNWFEVRPPGRPTPLTMSSFGSLKCTKIFKWTLLLYLRYRHLIVCERTLKQQFNNHSVNLTCILKPYIEKILCIKECDGKNILLHPYDELLKKIDYQDIHD